MGLLILNIVLSAAMWFMLPVGVLLGAACLFAVSYHRIWFGVVFFGVLNVVFWICTWNLAVAMIAHGGFLILI